MPPSELHVAPGVAGPGHVETAGDTRRPPQHVDQRATPASESSPILNRHDDNGLGTTARDGLRTIAQSLLDDFAETILGVLKRPGFSRACHLASLARRRPSRKLAHA